MSARVLLLAVALFSAVVGCGGTETGNPGGARVALGVRASDPALVDVGASSTGDRVEALLLVVDQAALVGCETRSPATPLFAHGAVVDLVRGAPGDTAVPAGEYCGLRVTLVAGSLPAVGDAPAIAGAAVAAYGLRADGVPFTVVSRVPRTIVTRADPFAVHAGEDLVLAFDVSLWLGGGLLESAPVVDGRATVDGTGDLAMQFDRQLTAGLFRDLNGDGTVDPNETTPLAALDPSGIGP